MAIDIFVESPSRIRSLYEIEDIIERVERYQQEIKATAGVVLVQNAQLGGYCIITSEKDAIDGLQKEKKFEWYAKYWSYKELQELRKNFKAA